MWIAGTAFLLGLLAQAAPGAESDRPAARAPAEEQAADAAERRATTPVKVDFRNAMGKSFRLEEIELFIDGRRLSHQVAGEGAELPRDLALWTGTLVEGPHTLVAHVVFGGRPRGPFRYLEAYKVRVDSVQKFTMTPHRSVGLVVKVDERPDRSAPLLAKPEVTVTAVTDEGVPSATIPAPEPRPAATQALER